MDTDTIKQRAEELRRDTAVLDQAADILAARGANRVAVEVRKRVVEWREQADEMERRA